MRPCERSLLAARDSAQLERKGITHVLNVGPKDTLAYFPQKFEYLTLGVEEDSSSNLLPKLPEALAFIERGRSHGVLVHCNSGLSRYGGALWVCALAIHLLLSWG